MATSSAGDASFWSGPNTPNWTCTWSRGIGNTGSCRQGGLHLDEPWGPPCPCIARRIRTGFSLQSNRTDQSAEWRRKESKFTPLRHHNAHSPMAVGFAALSSRDFAISFSSGVSKSRSSAEGGRVTVPSAFAVGLGLKGHKHEIISA